MAMQQCPNGHLFDDAKNSSCPFCSNGNSLNVTVPLNSDPQPVMGGGAFPATMPLDGGVTIPQPGVVGQNDFPSTTPVDAAVGVTQAIYAEDTESGVVPVRGWLICLEGAKRGADFKICAGNNTVGRGSSNDIKLEFDNTISKGVNAIISYDTRNNKFFIFLGESKNNIYVNNQLLMTPVELKDYDMIEIGSTKMIFRSLCNDKFNWDAAKKEEKAAE